MAGNYPKTEFQVHLGDYVGLSSVLCGNQFPTAFGKGA